MKYFLLYYFHILMFHKNLISGLVGGERLHMNRNAFHLVRYVLLSKLKTRMSESGNGNGKSVDLFVLFSKTVFLSFNDLCLHLNHRQNWKLTFYLRTYIMYTAATKRVCKLRNHNI